MNEKNRLPEKREVDRNLESSVIFMAKTLIFYLLAGSLKERRKKCIINMCPSKVFF